MLSLNQKDNEKIKIEIDPPFKLLKDMENKRPVFAVSSTAESKDSCVCCTKQVEDKVFVGVQYTYDPTKYSSLCVVCAISLGIVEDVEKPQVNPEVPKTQKQEGDKKKMGLLKSKKSAASSAPTAPTPEEKVSTLLVPSELNLGLELEFDTDEEEDETLSLGEVPPWVDDSATVNAGTPADLRSRIEAVCDDTTPSKGVTQDKASPVVATTTNTTPVFTGLSKSEVHDVVQMVVAEAIKEITTVVSKTKSELKQEFNKAISVLQQETRNNKDAIDVVFENLSIAGTYIKELTDKLEAALADEEEVKETPKTETAQATTTARVETAAVVKMEEPKKSSPKQATSKSGDRPVFGEYVKQFVGDSGANLEDLADALVEQAYFKSTPDDRSKFLADLTTLLNHRGFDVVDFFVTARETKTS